MVIEKLIDFWRAKAAWRLRFPPQSKTRWLQDAT